MAVAVQTRNPRFSVRFVTRRFGEIPADQFADAVTIQVARRLGDAAGTFQLQLVPREPPRGGAEEGWLDVLSPMDWVELSLWVPPRLPTVVMRGFVDTVHERFSIGGGEPRRGVTVAGRDYGKLLLVTKLFLLEFLSRGIAGGPAPLEILKRWLEGDREAFGRGKANEDLKPEAGPPKKAATPAAADDRPGLTPGEMLERVFDAFVEPQQDEILTSFPGVPRLAFASQAPAGADEDLRLITAAFDPVAWAPWSDVWSILAAYQHAPWRELFVEDLVDGPRLVYRPTPWLTREGDPVDDAHDVPGADGDGGHASPREISGSDVVEWALARADQQVHNYFFTYPAYVHTYAHAVKETPGLQGFMLEPFRGNPFLVGYREAQLAAGPADVGVIPADDSFQVFGFRPFEASTPYFAYPREARADELAKAIQERAEAARDENRILARAYGHGSLLESGVLQVAGLESVRLGDYVKVAPWAGRYGPRGRYYVEGYQHHFRQGTGPGDGHFYTALQVTRGRGHLARSGRGRE